MSIRVLSALAILAVVTAPVCAQTTGLPAPDNEAPEALFRLGPLSLQPRVRLTNLGVDNNVFNSAAAPSKDFTATLVPSLDYIVRAGRTVTTARTSSEFVYFHKFASQRSVAFSQEGRFDVMLARVRPFFTGGHINTHQRPNLEVDQRIEQSRDTVGAGVALRLSARTGVTVGHDRQHLRFDDSAFGSVARLLDRQVALTGVNLSLELTPLTTLIVRGEAQQDRFDTSTVRDSDSLAGLAGFDLKPFALISGKAMAGYRQITARDALMPDFGGLVANVDVVYRMRETTQVSITAGRNVEYSIEAEEPYYISAGGTVTVRQGIGRWDVLARGGRTNLHYQALQFPGASAPTDSRTDRHTQYGMGGGYRIGAGLRVGVDVTREERQSPVASRQYEGFRAGGTVTYGY